MITALRKRIGNVLFKMHAFKLAAWVYPDRGSK
jgi:hypothetical protein